MKPFGKKRYIWPMNFGIVMNPHSIRHLFLTSRSHYDVEKLLRAHCDLFLYCKYPCAKERAGYLIDFAADNLTAENIFGDNSTEWYTLAESFWDAFEILEIPRAKQMAERFEYREFWDLFY